MIRIGFFGNERLATGLEEISLKILPYLYNSNKFDVCFVALPSKVSSNTNSNRVNALEIETFCINNGIPLEFIIDNKSYGDLVKRYNISAAFVVAYGKLIPISFINQLNNKVINLHPSLLPEYRGSSPIEQVILDKRSYSGISLMQIAEQMDEGGIFAQKKIAIPHDITKSKLANSMLENGCKLISQNLDKIIISNIPPKPQNNNLASFTKRIQKKDGLINPNKLTLSEIDSHFRAMKGWPTTFFDWKSKKIIIEKLGKKQTRTKINLLWRENNTLYLSCLDGSIEIENLRIAGKNNISAADFINSYLK